MVHSTYIIVWFSVGCVMGGLTGWVCAMRAEQRWWRWLRTQLATDIRRSRACAAGSERSASTSRPVWS